MSVTYDDLMSDVADFRDEYFYVALPEVGRRHLETLIDHTVVQCLQAHDARTTFLRMLRFFVSIGRYPSYLELALTHPWLLARLVRLADASPLLTDFLIQNPLLFDDIVTVCQSRKLPTKEDMREMLSRELTRCADSAQRMQVAMRCFKHAQIVQLLSIDVDGDISLEAVSDHLSALADVILDTVVHAVARDMGFTSTPALAIVAYGKLGSREMSYVSDTDIVFLIDSISEEDEHLLTQFARRINAWITNYTEAGILYETDFRLRPEGDSGMLVCSIDAFRDYLENKAWTWEHQALVRARWCAGSERTGQAFEQIRLEVLGKPRDDRTLSRDIQEMRETMLSEHPPEAHGFDVKHSRGGIVDVEFIVQYLVLRHGAKHGELFEHAGNIRLLRYAARFGLVDSSLAEKCAEAYRQYRIWLHQHRLRGQEKVVVREESAARHAHAVGAMWAAVFGSPDN